MGTFGLEEWIDREFGVGDERLWTDARGLDELDRLLATQERKYETERRRLASLDRAFEDIASADVSGDGEIHGKRGRKRTGRSTTASRSGYTDTGFVVPRSSLSRCFGTSEAR